MSIQNNVNAMIGTIGGAVGIGTIAKNQMSELENKRQTIKYNNLALTEEGKFLSNIDDDARKFIQENPEVREGIQNITNDAASQFKHEAMATDAAEAKYKKLGLDSDSIREKGLQRKKENMEGMQGRYKEYLEKAMEAQWSMTNAASEKFVAKAAPAAKRAQLEGILESDSLSDPSKRMYYAHRG